MRLQLVLALAIACVAALPSPEEKAKAQEGPNIARNCTDKVLTEEERKKEPQKTCVYYCVTTPKNVFHGFLADGEPCRYYDHYGEKKGWKVGKCTKGQYDTRCLGEKERAQEIHKLTETQKNQGKEPTLNCPRLNVTFTKQDVAGGKPKDCKYYCYEGFGAERKTFFGYISDGNPCTKTVNANEGKYEDGVCVTPPGSKVTNCDTTKKT